MAKSRKSSGKATRGRKAAGAGKHKKVRAAKPATKKKAAAKAAPKASSASSKPSPKSSPKPSLARAAILKGAARRPVKDRQSVKRLPGARPAPHKASSLAANIYDRDLDKTAANYATLTPLQFLERSASVYPDHVALVHGSRRQSWSETYRRCRQLASALEKAGIGKGDTVTIMAPNIPEMYEAHFGVPMTGGVLNCLNTRLNAAMLAFILDHSETKVLLVDREYHRVVTEALAIAQVQPLVVDIDDPQCDDRGQIGDTTYEEFLALKRKFQANAG